MLGVFLQHNPLIGTIPQWDNWIWPYSISITSITKDVNVPCELEGNLPQFNDNNINCPLLQYLIVSYCKLNGTIEKFPKTLCFQQTKNDSIFSLVTSFTYTYLDFASNNFIGTVPFDTLTTPSFVFLFVSWFLFFLYVTS